MCSSDLAGVLLETGAATALLLVVVLGVLDPHAVIDNKTTRLNNQETVLLTFALKNIINLPLFIII